MMVKTSHAGRRDPDLWERTVNDQWGGKQPILSGQESIAAARKLYRHATGQTFKGKVQLTSGNRVSWVKREHVVVRSGGPAVMGTVRNVLTVNPDRNRGGLRGLRAMIHDLSHACHRRLNPNDSDHSARQARLEARLVKFAIDRRWAEGTLRREPPPAPTKPDLVVQRHARLVARRDKWQREADRAKRLLAKAESEVRAYERRHRDRLGN